MSEYLQPELPAEIQDEQPQPDTYDYPDPYAQEPEMQTPEKPKKKRRIGRKILWVVLVALGALAAWQLYILYLTPDRNVQQIYLVPPDAAILIHSSEPVRDWERFSKSEPWQGLKKAPSFAAIAESTEALDEPDKA